MSNIPCLQSAFLPLDSPKLVTQRQQSVCLECTLDIQQTQSLPPGSTSPHAIVEGSVAEQERLISEAAKQR